MIKHSAKFALALMAALSMAMPAQAWGPTGHKLVASLAEDLLNPNAKAQVHDILDAHYDLSQAATWADCVRDVNRLPDGTFKYQPNPKYVAPCVAFKDSDSEVARMEDYVSRNYDNCSGRAPCAADYHFADVPIQAGHYAEGGIGTEDFDVIHAIRACIDVLQGKPAPAPFSLKDKKEALILLAHFVGDLHQPLHVGAIYLTAAGHPIDPQTPQDAANDSTFGGNQIMTSKTEKLHALWDSIPAGWASGATRDALLADARAVPAPTGDMQDWPAQWAGDSIEAAQGAFTTLKFKHKKGKIWNAQSTDPNGFLKYRLDTQKTQIARGAARLADILNAIWPETAAAPAQ